jgi:hypothetical protein
MLPRAIGSFALVVALLSPSRVAGAATTIKIGTLAPQDSPWGREFKAWAAAVASDTGGEVTLDFAWNGQAGDEKLMVEKIRSPTSRPRTSATSGGRCSRTSASSCAARSSAPSSARRCGTRRGDASPIQNTTAPSNSPSAVVKTGG